jgi:hypothetical protein
MQCPSRPVYPFIKITMQLVKATEFVNVPRRRRHSTLVGVELPDHELAKLRRLSLDLCSLAWAG